MCVDTRQMSVLATEEMSAVKTAQMSSAETGQMSAVETSLWMYSIETQFISQDKHFFHGLSWENGD